MIVRQAPELQTSHWFNTDTALTLESLRGRVVAIEAFQMHCPGCVSHGLPQAKRIAETFNPDDVTVLGDCTRFSSIMMRRERSRRWRHSCTNTGSLSLSRLMRRPATAACPKPWPLTACAAHRRFCYWIERDKFATNILAWSRTS